VKKAKIFSLVFIPSLKQYVITLEEIEGSRLVPIWIGLNEGNAIALSLQGERPPRPMTHDLLKNILDTLAVKLEKVIISDLKENTYYASIDLMLDGKQYEIDSRPSDSLALAVRAHLPVYIEERVLENCPIIRKPITSAEVEKFKNEMESIDPADFFNRMKEEIE